MQLNLSKKSNVAIFAILCTFLWGSVFPIIKTCYKEFEILSSNIPGQIIFAGTRYFAAGIITLMFITKSKKKKTRIAKSSLLHIVLLGILQTTIVTSLFYIGLAHTSGMKAALLMALPTFFTVVLAPLFFKNDGLNWQKILGLAGGFLGVFLVNFGKDLSLDFNFIGEGLLIIVGLASGLSNIFSKKISQKVSPVAVSGYQQLFGASLMVIYGIFSRGISSLEFSWKGLIFLVYLAGITALSRTLWCALLKYNKPSHVTIFGFGTPVFGSILSALFLPGESFSFTIICAMALIAFSVFLVNSEHKSIREAVPAERGY